MCFFHEKTLKKHLLSQEYISSESRISPRSWRYFLDQNPFLLTPRLIRKYISRNTNPEYKTLDLNILSDRNMPSERLSSLLPEVTIYLWNDLPDREKLCSQKLLLRYFPIWISRRLSMFQKSIPSHDCYPKIIRSYLLDHFAKFTIPQAE